MKYLIGRVNETIPILFETDNYEYDLAYQFIKDLKTINLFLTEICKGSG